MRVVYVAHQLSGPDRDKHIANAARWCTWAAMQGVAPVCTWITLAGQWDETPEYRERGLAIDCALVERCDEVWLVGGRVSPGMKVEADHALSKGIKVVDLTELGYEAPS